MPGCHAQPLRTRGEERVELLLEAGCLRHPELEGGERRIDHAVEHERADVGGEEVGVGRAEQRAVGDAEERQLLVAELLCAAAPGHEQRMWSR